VSLVVLHLLKSPVILSSRTSGSSVRNYIGKQLPTGNQRKAERLCGKGGCCEQWWTKIL
jgi:hypothetical protein